MYVSSDPCENRFGRGSLPIPHVWLGTEERGLGNNPLAGSELGQQ